MNYKLINVNTNIIELRNLFGFSRITSGSKFDGGKKLKAKRPQPPRLPMTKITFESCS